MLENENYRVTFGPNSAAPYLSKTLPAEGALLQNYHGVTHLSLGNYKALVSGQGNDLQTQIDCPFYSNFRPGVLDSEFDFNSTATLRIGRYDQARGQGCVFPTAVQTIADQVAAKGLTWKAYMDDMQTPCLHPEIDTRDTTLSATDVPGGLYAVRHNPFVYFHSIIDSPSCAQNDVPLDRLPSALRSIKTTANYSFITPDVCNDGHDEPCVNGQPGGLVQVNSFLEKWVPAITSSPAFKEDGLLLILFDEASPTNTRACCNEKQFPNTPNNAFLFPGRGGGRTGAVALSPFIKPGTVTREGYNHFSTLKTVEQLFGLKYLGYATQTDLRPFGRDVFTAAPPSH